MKDAFGNDFWIGDEIVFSFPNSNRDQKLGRGIIDRIVNSNVTSVYVKGCSIGISPDCIWNFKKELGV